jgi:hypothetical protein
MTAAQHPTIDARQETGGRWTLDRAVAVLRKLVEHQDVPQADAVRAINYVDRRFLKVGDVQAILGFKSATSVKKWQKQGAFPGAHKEGRDWMFPADVVYALRDGSLRAARMNAAKKIEQQVFEGDDIYAELGL